MLPFLEPKKMSSVIIARRGKPDVEASPEIDMSSEDNKLDPALREAATDIMRAFESKSVSGLAHALKAAYEICSSSPSDNSDFLSSDED